MYGPLTCHAHLHTYFHIFYTYQTHLRTFWTLIISKISSVWRYTSSIILYASGCRSAFAVVHPHHASIHPHPIHIPSPQSHCSAEARHFLPPSPPPPHRIRLTFRTRARLCRMFALAAQHHTHNARTPRTRCTF